MIVVFGSINLDLIFGLPHIPAAGETVLGPSMRIEPGGKGANQAVAAARDGAAVAMIGAVGEDALADAALQILRPAAVDLSRVRVVEASTGCAAIAVDPAGRNAISVGSGANLYARADWVEAALLTPETTLVLQMEVPAAEAAAVITRGRKAGCRIVLNLAPAGRLPSPALQAVDVLVVNQAEGGWLAGELGCAASASALRRTLTVPAVVLTKGEAGAEVAETSGSWLQPAVAVQAVDTTAAGDCFVGVLAHRLDRGEALRAGAQRAARAAALCCTRQGSQGSLPTAAETDAFHG